MNNQKKVPKKVSMFIQMPWQAVYVPASTQIIYNNKLEHKYTLTPLAPKSLCIGPIQAKEYLSIRNTCVDPYSCLSILCILYLAPYNAARHLFVLCSVGQLLTRITQLLTQYISYTYHFTTIFIKFIQYHDILRPLEQFFDFLYSKSFKMP